MKKTLKVLTLLFIGTSHHNINVQATDSYYSAQVPNHIAQHRKQGHTGNYLHQQYPQQYPFAAINYPVVETSPLATKSQQKSQSWQVQQQYSQLNSGDKQVLTQEWGELEKCFNSFYVKSRDIFSKSNGNGTAEIDELMRKIEVGSKKKDAKTLSDLRSELLELILVVETLKTSDRPVHQILPSQRADISRPAAPTQNIFPSSRSTSHDDSFSVSSPMQPVERNSLSISSSIEIFDKNSGKFVKTNINSPQLNSGDKQVSKQEWEGFEKYFIGFYDTNYDIFSKSNENGTAELDELMRKIEDGSKKKDAKTLSDLRSELLELILVVETLKTSDRLVHQISPLERAKIILAKTNFNPPQVNYQQSQQQYQLAAIQPAVINYPVVGPSPLATEYQQKLQSWQTQQQYSQVNSGDKQFSTKEWKKLEKDFFDFYHKNLDIFSKSKENGAAELDELMRKIAVGSIKEDSKTLSALRSELGGLIMLVETLKTSDRLVEKISPLERAKIISPAAPTQNIFLSSSSMSHDDSFSESSSMQSVDRNSQNVTGNNRISNQSSQQYYQSYVQNIYENNGNFYDTGRAFAIPQSLDYVNVKST